MPQSSLFNTDSARAARQPKTDRLILERLLKNEARNFHLTDDLVDPAHEVLLRWAELETRGRLERLNETQMQGDVLGEIFGQALGYSPFSANTETWNLLQHHEIAGETPDAVLGNFRQDNPVTPLAVIELKGPGVHLDRDRSNGRTAVQQCWDYLNNTPPECRWGIVSNVISFRLYERNSTRRKYEHFTLQGLRDKDEFKRFFVLLRREGLISRPSLAERLVAETGQQQATVSDKLYDLYSNARTQLIEHLQTLAHPTDAAIEMAQRLLDRVIFIAFCEDRQLLPQNTIEQARAVSGFHDVTNPRWRNFKRLFKFIDVGNLSYNIPKYNGELFKPHDVDNLDLPDEPWTNFFESIGKYDFRDEVNLEVLGHLFEKSITELEKFKQVGIYNLSDDRRQALAHMPQSVKRKQLGIYYTPAELTSRIVQYTVEELIVERFAAVAVEHGIPLEQGLRGVAPDNDEYWQQCLAILQDLKIVDPACGSGAFLFQAYNVLEQRYNEVVGQLDRRELANADELAAQIPHWILGNNLYGVDLSPEAVEITQLALWIRSATRGQTLASLSRNIVHGNSLVHDPEVHAAGFDWHTRFPEVFARPSPLSPRGRGAGGEGARKGKSSPSPRPSPSRGEGENQEDARGSESEAQGGFDCVIGNPPWERIKLQEREFFSLPAPEIATATNAAKRRQLVAKLESDDPALYERYQAALNSADALLTYCRKSDQYPLTGRGDINLYAVFAELAFQLVAPNGRVGLLTPSGIASDMTTKDFFAAVSESNRLIRLYDFENKRNFFPEVHASFKFCILNFGGSEVSKSAADFVFFIHQVEELEKNSRHVALSGADIRLLNPNTRTCPIFRSKRDAEITKAIYRRVPVLIDESRTGPTGNAWGISFKRMFDQTNDAELFREAASPKAEGFKLEGNRWIKRTQVCLPVYEAKMVQAYDHRAADVVTDEANWVRQGQTDKRSLVQWQNPEQLATPRFWVEAHHVDLPPWGSVGFKDITSPTNQRTMIAAFGPLAGYTNHFVLVRSEIAPRMQACLLGNLNSFIYDYCTRQKIGGVTLNFFIVEQIPTLTPDTYSKPCPWKRGKLEAWISERVLKLTCTAEDMLPLAEACDFTGGSFKTEYGGRLNKWDEEERARLMAELDAAYFHLYGIDRDDAEYILSTFKGIHDRSPLLPDGRSTAEHILSEYDRLGSRK